MTRFRAWFAVIGLGMLAIAVLGPWGPKGTTTTTNDSDDDTAPNSALRDRRLSSLPQSSAQLGANVAATPAIATNPALSIAARVEPLMNDWRGAIIKKDPEVVESLDRTFAAYPREFVPALMASAETDPEERVRSFSTRVLGKLRPPESTELMRRLLADKSEYVRFNAAWALGELADLAAVPRLRQLQRRDPSSNVRRSATESLRKMEGA